MMWLEAHIAGDRDGKQVPFLFRLDRENHIKQLDDAIKDPESLLDWMASRVQAAAPGDLAVIGRRWNTT